MPIAVSHYIQLLPNLAADWRFPQAPFLSLINLLDQLVELRETLTYVCQFMKEYDVQPNGGLHRVKSGTILNTGASGSRGAGVHHPPDRGCVHQPGSFPNPAYFGHNFGGFLLQV